MELPENIKQKIEAEAQTVPVNGYVGEDSPFREAARRQAVKHMQKGAELALESTGWISVEGRLPDEPKDTDDGDSYMTFPHPHIRYWREGAFWEYDAGRDRDIIAYVTHWKHIGPLPISKP